MNERDDRYMEDRTYEMEAELARLRRGARKSGLRLSQSCSTLACCSGVFASDKVARQQIKMANASTTLNATRWPTV
jgi:hypothetical protein